MGDQLTSRSSSMPRSETSSTMDVVDDASAALATASSLRSSKASFSIDSVSRRSLA